MPKNGYPTRWNAQEATWESIDRYRYVTIGTPERGMNGRLQELVTAARRAWGIAIFALLLGCGPGRPDLQPVALPDISNAAESVQGKIRERFASLTTATRNSGSQPAELAAQYGDLGKLFLAAEYLDAAEACFVNAGTLAPAEMRWPYFLGHVFRLKNDPARAVPHFKRALALRADHVPSLVWLGEMHLAQNFPEAAERELMKARSLDSTSGAVLSALGRVALARHDYAQAAALLESALAAGPHATRIHYPLALAYRALGDRDKAEKHLQLRGEVDLAPVDPLFGEVASLLQNATAYETSGSRALEARRWSEAVASFRKAIELAPGNAFSRMNLGTALYMQGDADGALEEYRAAVRLSPGLAKAHFGAGAIVETRGMDREAIEAFAEAVKHDPGYIEARFSLANALRRVGRVKESLPHYEEVLRANPAVSQAGFGHAMGLVRLGRYADARARLEDSLMKFPDQTGFAHALARLLAAAPDDGVRNGKRALSIITDLMKAQRTPAMGETMAMALAELGRFADAARWQRDVIEFTRTSGRTDTLPRLTENLRLYESGRPCRTPWADDDPVHRPRPSEAAGR